MSFKGLSEDVLCTINDCSDLVIDGLHSVINAGDSIVNAGHPIVDTSHDRQHRPPYCRHQ
jgi:hypothetical protein